MKDISFQMPSHKKYTLAIPAEQPRKPKIAREYFFSLANKLKNKKFPSRKKNKTSFHRTMRTPTFITTIVQRLEQIVCGLQTVVLRTNSRAAYNISSRCTTTLKSLLLFCNPIIFYRAL
jgi:hypothetical protein